MTKKPRRFDRSPVGTRRLRLRLSQVLQELRKAAGLSARDVAEALGRSHPVALRWESGDRAPYLHDLPVIAAAYKTTPENLAKKIATAP